MKKTNKTSKTPPRTTPRKSHAAPFYEGLNKSRSVRPPKTSRSTSGKPAPASAPTEDAVIRLNRFIALSGLCSRREADTWITKGLVKVNGKIVTELGTKVHRFKDRIQVKNQVIQPEQPVYILLNKPKNYITTASDPEGRSTVMELIRGATSARVYPVGRLDRNTTGILLFTNDGALAKKLTHPSHQIKKLYYVRVNKPFADQDAERMLRGIELDDGKAKADKVGFVEDSGKMEVGVEIHSGRNRVVRRMFEKLGYKIVALDRVSFGPISRKGCARGQWRFLTQQEINHLKMIS